jgi:hypothetical protein
MGTIQALSMKVISALQQELNAHGLPVVPHRVVPAISQLALSNTAACVTAKLRGRLCAAL